MIDFEQWEGFEGRIWKEEVNVRDFIQKNYTPYDGDESFLAGPTEATDKLWGALQKLQKAERAKGGVLDMETEVVSGLTAYGPGYIDESLKEFEQIVGLQTDKPLKRAFMPYGGIKMAEQACTTYGYQPSEELHKIFTDYTRTHNQAVFDAYTPEMKTARHTHIITGLPDTYGRGRIVGDYRRVALYGIDALIKFKQEDFANCGDGTMTDDVIRLREEDVYKRQMVQMTPSATPCAMTMPRSAPSVSSSGPACMVPPVTTTEGMFTRARPMRFAGIPLSQLGMYSAKYERGEIDEAKLNWAKQNACPSCGRCV